MQEQLSLCYSSTAHASDRLAIQFVEIGIPNTYCIIVRRSYLEATVLWLLCPDISVILPGARHR